MTMNNKALTEGVPWRGILSFMIPVLLGLLLQQLYNTVDTIIVGNFAGEAPLAAVGACGVLTMAFLALANGFSAGACILIAQLFGAGKKERYAQAGVIITADHDVYGHIGHSGRNSDQPFCP